MTEPLEIQVFLYFWTPGTIGSLIFLVSWDPGNIGNLSLQHSPESLKYYPNPKPNPNPNPYPFLDPGRVISCNAGRPGPGRRAGSRNPNSVGGLRPPDPRSGFFRAVRGPASHFCYHLILLFLIQCHICSRHILLI